MPKPRWIHVLLIVTCLVGIPAPVDGALSKRLKTLVKQKIVPAYFREDTETSHKLLTGMLDKLDTAELTEVEAILTAEGVPSVGELLLDARLKQVLPNHAQKQGPADPREASLALPVLYERINAVIKDVEGLEFFTEQLPDYATIQEYQDAFWDIHVATNKLRNAARMTKYGAAFVDSALQGKLKDLGPEELEQLDIDFDALAPQISQVATELNEIKMEMRVRGVAKASDIIRNSKDFKQRLRASYVVGFDGQQVIQLLRNKGQSEFTRPMLRQDGLLESVEAHVRLVNDSAGDLASKSQLLYLGMHWWLRGRYGQGPEGMGLVKSKAALTSPLAQFPLYMPLRPPTPTDPTLTGYSIPKFDRRHHYIWMYEYRQLNVNRSTTSTTNIDQDETRTDTSRTKLSRFY